MLAIPLYDDTPKIHMPLATAALITACSLVFFWQTGLPPRAAVRAIYSYGMIPAVLFGAASEIPVVVPSSPTFVSHLALQSADLPNRRQHQNKFIDTQLGWPA